VNNPNDGSKYTNRKLSIKQKYPKKIIMSKNPFVEYFNPRYIPRIVENNNREFSTRLAWRFDDHISDARQ
jgi:hypothetical protein